MYISSDELFLHTVSSAQMNKEGGKRYIRTDTEKIKNNLEQSEVTKTNTTKWIVKRKVRRENIWKQH